MGHRSVNPRKTESSRLSRDQRGRREAVEIGQLKDSQMVLWDYTQAAYKDEKKNLKLDGGHQEEKEPKEVVMVCVTGNSNNLPVPSSKY